MALWTPNLLSELFAWYKADSLSLSDGDPIDTLTDSDSGTYSLTSSGAARPTYTTNALNSLPVMTFSGAQRLTSGTTTPWAFLNQSTGGTVIAVWKAGNVSDPNALYGLYGNNGGSVNNQGIYCIYDDRAVVPRNDLVVLAQRSTAGGAGNDFYLSLTNDGSFTANQANLLSTYHDGANSTAANKLLIAINGGSLSGNNTGTKAVSTSSPTYAFQLGAVGNNVFPLTGYIAEVCIFNSVLDTTNRQLTEGYLAWKWGIEANLASGHPYENAAPTTGIARPKINGSLLNRGLINGSLVK
jgi:hypothetical protein